MRRSILTYRIFRPRGTPSRLLFASAVVLVVAGCTEPRNSGRRDGGAGGSGGMARTGGSAGASSSGGGSGGQPATGTGGTSGAAGSGTGSGGRPATGGAGAAGAAGTGGATATGGASATGGRIGGTGGTSTGGSGSGGSAGTGGTSAACQANATQCMGTSIATCGGNGQWGAAAPCPARQSCTGPAGTARCTCTPDTVCTAVGTYCASTTVTVCMQDAQQCFYQASSSPCTNGACSGTPGAATCCTNACTAGTAQCQSGKTLQTCAAPAGGCTALTATTCATGTVCERHAPACEDPNWAAWPMPNSATEVNAASYKDNGDGTVTDLVTALMWQKSPTTDTYIWSAAITHCPQLTLGGHNDWRLPTFIELMSLVDFGAGSPAVNTTYFPAMSGGLYWTATPVTGQNNFAWDLNFNTGTGNADSTAGPNPVICVR